MDFIGYGVQFSSVKPLDIIYLRNSRNAPEISSQMIDNSYISASKQRIWYENISSNNNIAYWVIWKKDVRVGVINIDLKKTKEEKNEINLGGYIYSRKVKHGLLGMSMVLAQLDLVFHFLHLNRVEILVKKNNDRAIKFNKYIGYIKIMEDSDYVYFSMDRDNYISNKLKFDRYFKECNVLKEIQ